VTLPVNPLALTSASPAGLASNPSDFEVWPSIGMASGGSQGFTATATTAVVACSNSTAVGAQACFYPYTGTDYGLFLSCMKSSLSGLDIAKCAVAAVVCGSAPATVLGAASCLSSALSCGGAVGPIISGCLKKSLILGPQICISDQLPCVLPADPNSLVGLPGVGSQRWASGTQALTYGISFGNEPTATAPAQQVVVTQPLGASMNLSTLSLPRIIVPNGTSNIQVPVPLGSFNPVAGVNEFTTNVDLRPTQSLLVGMDAKLNPTTQTLTWTFTSIDPNTGLPPLNPLVGFLPPGSGASVSFTVTPTPGLATGTQVTQQAAVVFDVNPPMNTPAWFNTIDNTPPVSHVATLPSSFSCPNFRVSWSGSDAGSGLQGFTVYSSDNGGAFTPWLSNTTAAAGTFTGTAGHVYSFYSIATDLTGNVEASKTSAEASTSVTVASSCGPPSLTAQMLNVAQSGTTVTANLQLTNTGFTAAQAVNISQFTLRTLNGAGTVTLTSPTLPLAVGSLAVGATTTVPLTFNVPSTVTRFSVTEGGTIQDASGNGYSFSMAQTIIH